MAAPVFTLAQIARQLQTQWGTVTNGIDQEGITRTWYEGVIEYAMPDVAPNGDPGIERDRFVAMDATQKAFAREAFELWDDLIQLPLTETGSENAHVTLAYSSRTDGDGTYTSAFLLGQLPGTADREIMYERIWLNAGWDSLLSANMAYGKRGPLTFIHEIGHSLGLSHPGTYDAGDGKTYKNGGAEYSQDTQQWTVMSYFKAGDDDTVIVRQVPGNNYVEPATPMLHDIVAIQSKYGADTTTRTGNTVYGFNSNADRGAFDFSLNTNPVVTIWDAGGSDTLDLSGFGQNQRIDLRAGSFSDVGALTLNVAIAYNVVIENAIGGAGNDSITGNDADNVLVGSAGDDTLMGGKGADQLFGGAGDDELTGGLGYQDVLFGGTGHDTYFVDDQDTIVEGFNAGFDEVNSTISWVLGNNLENLYLTGRNHINGAGNGLDNVLVGNSGNNVLQGLGGADWLLGGDGDDTYELADTWLIDERSGWRYDRVSEPADGGIDTVSVSYAGLDRYTLDDNVEQVVVAGLENLTVFGNELGNRMVGNAAYNLFYGGAGDDRLDGRAGNDDLFGGTGSDLYILDDIHRPSEFHSYRFDTVYEGVDEGLDTVWVNSLSHPAFGYPINYTLTANVENGVITGAETFTLSGNDGANALTGNGAANTLNGLDGNDTLFGAAGDDLLVGGDGDDTYILDDIHRPGEFYSYRFDAVSEGVDGGIDTVRVTALSHPVFGYPIGYTLPANVENIEVVGGGGLEVIANDLGNRLFGNAGSNRLRGLGGNDVIYAGSGSDDVDGGDDDDFVNGGSNDALLSFGGFGVVTGYTGAADTLAGGAGTDTLSFEGLYGIFPDNVAAGLRFGVAINLATNVTGGAATGTVISGFENLVGTDYGDQLTGDGGPNVFEPLRGGGHTQSATTSGPDRIDGVGGEDTLRIDFSRADVANSLGIVTNGNTIYRLTIGNLAYVDSYIFENIEHLDITGASKYDSLYANVRGQGDILRGLAGDDTLGGYGGADTLLGGDGNDALIAQGRALFDRYDGIAGGHDVFDGGAGDDTVEDIAFGANNFNGFYLSADALFQLDGGSGFDTFSVDFSNQSAAIVWDSAAPTNIEFADGAHARNFELLRDFGSGAGNDAITQHGRIDNRFVLGAGNDIVNPGLGIDLVWAGAGDDLLVLDYSAGDGVNVGGVSFGGFYFERRDLITNETLDRIVLRDFERYQITGGGKNDSLSGGDGADTLSGHAGDDSLTGNGGIDVLSGDAGNDTLIGGSGNDLLSGGAGDDVFVFAGTSSGTDLVTDPEAGDILRITGAAFGAASFVASAVGLAANQIHVGSADGVTTVSIGLDAIPGADLAIRLQGTLSAAGFAARGSDISLLAINHAPTGTASATLVDGLEDSAYVITPASLLQGFSDVDGDALSVDGLSADQGQLLTDASGGWTLVPAPNVNGLVALSYNVIDGRGGSIGAAQSFVLGAVNDPAVLDSAAVTLAETNAPIHTGGRLGISDIDSAAVFVAQPATPGLFGVFNIAPDGAWTYAANGAFNELDVGDSISDLFAVSSADGTSGSVSITITGTAEAAVMRLGDAPVRQSGSGGQWQQAWTQAGYGLSHKADHGDLAQAWTPVSLHGVSPQLLSGGDIFAGDLGVSGQSRATGAVRQEIDGREALRITLPGMADSVTVRLASLLIDDDGSVFRESGLLRLLDATGHLVAERAFVADSAGGTKTVTLEAASGFASMELLAGAFDGAGTFVYGGYSTGSGGYGGPIFGDAAGRLHGSEFLLDAVEFSVPLVGVVPTADGVGLVFGV